MQKYYIIITVLIELKLICVETLLGYRLRMGWCVW